MNSQGKGFIWISRFELRFHQEASQDAKQPKGKGKGGKGKAPPPKARCQQLAKEFTSGTDNCLELVLRQVSKHNLDILILNQTHTSCFLIKV